MLVNDVIPAGFKFVGCPQGGKHDFSTRTVSWFVGDLEPGKSKEVHLNVIAVNPGEHHHKVAAQAARGLKAENEALTRVEGLSAILLEVVDTQDPIEVGADTSYEIRITNTGTKTETEIRVACTIPDQMTFKAAQGPVRFVEQGKVVVFEPLPKLAPVRRHLPDLRQGVRAGQRPLQDATLQHEPARSGHGARSDSDLSGLA